MTLAIVQARMASTRLPGKVMREVLGKPLIAHMLERLDRSKKIDKIVVATSTDASNDPLCVYLLKQGVEVYRGSEEDVLDRFYQAASLCSPDVVVRLTADCPLIDPKIVDQVIEKYEKGGLDYAATASDCPGYPDGLDAEVMSFNTLERAWKEARLPSEREHVTPFIKKSSEFRKESLRPEKDLVDERWTVDTEEDFILVKNILEHFHPKNDSFGMEEILKYKNDAPGLFEVNRRFKRNEGYAKSLAKDQTVSRSKTVIADAGSYSAAIVVTQLVTVVAALLMRKFLGPVQVGVWAIVQLVLTYAEYSQLGTMNAIIREIPYYRGKGEEAKAECIKNTVFTFSLISAALCSVGTLIYALIFRNMQSTEMFWGLCIAAVILIPLQRMNSLSITMIRSLKRFDLAGRQMIYSALVNTVLVAVLSYRFRFYGFMAAMCLSFLFNFGYLYRREPFRFRPVLSLGELRSLIGYGLPFMMLALIGTLFDTIDRIMISRFIGLEALGLYSIALMTATYIYSVPNAVSVVLVPNLHEIFGKNDDARDLRGYLFKSDTAFTTLIPLFTGLAWFVMPSVVRSLLPEFTGGIEAMRILVLGVFFLAVGQAYSQFIYVVKKQLMLVPVSLAACALAAVFSWVAICAGWGLVGVAAATALAVFCHYAMLYWNAAPQVLSTGECWQHFAETLGKFALMCTLLFTVDRWVRVPGLLGAALLKTTIYSVAYAPFLVQLERRFGVIDILRERFSKKGATS